MKCGKLLECFRLMKKNVFVFSLVCILMCLFGCDLWYQDWKGYMEHWSENVQVSDVSVQASPEIQKNSSGVDTIASYATVKATVNIINPENYSLDGGVGSAEENLRSVRIAGSAGSSVLPLANVTSMSSTAMEIQIAPLAQVLTEESLALEHTNFTVTFVPTRTENGFDAAEPRTITLRYNTPPRNPLELVLDTTQQKLTWLNSNPWEIIQGTSTPLDNYIFWAWPSVITDPTHPDYVERFEVYEDGELFDSAAAADFLMSKESALQSYIPQEIKVAGYDIYCSLGTSGKTITVCAVDSEGVRSQMATSGIAPHKVILEANGGFFPSSRLPSVETYKAAGSIITGSDLEVPFRDGYFLTGWTSNGSAVSFPLSIDQPMTLVAQWTPYPADGETGGNTGSGSGSASDATYSITYDANGADGGTVPASQTKLAGKTVTLAKNSGNLTKEHHTFSGWNTQADGKGQFYGEGTTYATDANVTLYAQWTPNPSTGSDITGPGAVTGISSIKKNNFEPVITWTNPSDSDFDRTEITCSDGNISITINGNVATFMGIVSGKEYEVTFTTYDYTGNIGQTVTQKLTWNTIALDSLIGTGFTKNGVDVSNPNATGSKLVLWFLSGETISLAEYIQYEPNVTADATFTWWKNPATGGKVTSSDSIILDKAYTFYANYSVMSADYAVVYVEAALKGTSSCTHDITVVGSMTNDQLKELGSPLKDSNLPPVEINLDLSQTTGLTTIVKDAFRGAEGLTSIILPESIESIEEGAFYGCSFSSIEFPSSLKTLGKDAFKNCGNLEQVIMPSSSSLSSIGEQAFMYCQKLSQITIPSSVTVIDEWAFYWCKSITSLTIPASVIYIVDPFYECGSTLVLTMEASNPPNIVGGMEVKQIRVPKGSVEQYQAVDALSYVKGRIVGY